MNPLQQMRERAEAVITPGAVVHWRSVELARDVLALLDVVEAAKNLHDGYPQSKMHKQRGTEGICDWCGQPWPCPTAVLAAALSNLEAKE